MNPLLRTVLVVLFAVPCMSATLDYYVDTDNGSNGNNGFAGHPVKNLNQAILLTYFARPLTNPTVIHCKGSAPDTVMCTGRDCTTSLANSLTIQVDLADRHHGVWDNSKYHLEVTDNLPITVLNSYQKLLGLQIKLITVTNDFKHAISLSATYVPGVSTVQDCIIVGQLGSVATDACGIHCGLTVGNTQNVVNCIFDGWVNGTHPDCIAVACYATDYMYNNTVVNCYTGFYNGVGTTNMALAINNLFVNCPRPFIQNGAYGTFASGTDYNATDQASLGVVVTGGDGAHEMTSINTTNLFTSYALHNFNLTPYSAVKGMGKTDPASGLFSDDITGNARVVPWDIGAFAYGVTLWGTSINGINTSGSVVAY